MWALPPACIMREVCHLNTLLYLYNAIFTFWYSEMPQCCVARLPVCSYPVPRAYGPLYHPAFFLCDNQESWLRGLHCMYHVYNVVQGCFWWCVASLQRAKLGGGRALVNA